MARRFRDQAHREPTTLGEAWDAARRDPGQTLRDLAALVFLAGAILALLIVLAPTQGVPQ